MLVERMSSLEPPIQYWEKNKEKLGTACDVMKEKDEFEVGDDV